MRRPGTEKKEDNDKKKLVPKQSAGARAVVEDLQRRLGTRVRLKEIGGGRGTLEVDFFSHEDLERILALIRRER